MKKVNALKKTKYLFLKNPQSFTKYQTLKFHELNAINLKTSIAWRQKENFKAIYFPWSREEIIHTFKTWYLDVVESEINPMIKAAGTLLRHLKGIVTASITQLTNSVAENINAKIQLIKATARGFKNINGYRNSILFFNGNLDLFPL